MPLKETGAFPPTPPQEQPEPLYRRLDSPLPPDEVPPQVQEFLSRYGQPNATVAPMIDEATCEYLRELAISKGALRAEFMCTALESDIHYMRSNNVELGFALDETYIKAELTNIFKESVRLARLGKISPSETQRLMSLPLPERREAWESIRKQFGSMLSAPPLFKKPED